MRQNRVSCRPLVEGRLRETAKVSDDSTSLAEAPCRYRRVLGRIRGRSPGSTLIALGGIHGNEPSGVEAARRVLGVLEREQPDLAGEFVCVAGNLVALEQSRRFVDLDLNRQWTPDKVAALRDASREDGEPAEHDQQREIIAVLREVIGSARGDVHFVDMHTSSAPGPPFVTVGDTMRNRKFARTFPLPLILGLEEQIDGALLELINNQGPITMAVEAGLHDSPRSVAYHEAMLWLALVAAGMILPDAVPDYAGRREMLQEASRSVPPVVGVRKRHRIRKGDDFRMEPGYVNFQPIRSGQLLAHDRKGPVYAPEDGRILLPLYQGQGDDGFFVAKVHTRLWLRISGLLRRLRVNGLVRFLPGVRRHPRRREVLFVNTRVARLYPMEFFHILGFRKVRQIGTHLLISRRLHDLAAPERISFCQPGETT